MAQEGTARDDRYYQIVFIWMRDPETFARYQKLAAPVVSRYGGALERMLLPETIYADGMGKPDIVNIVFCDSREAFVAFGLDPDFQRVVPLRSASIEMVAVDGVPMRGVVTQDGIAQRTYLVEVARFGPLGMKGYIDYEAQTEPLMRRYGYHVERVFTPDAEAGSGFPFRPDLVKVAYFDDQSGLDRWHEDAAHQRVERELYPAAVEQSIWVTGRVHPTMFSAESSEGQA